jgi:hypothetical protein
MEDIQQVVIPTLSRMRIARNLSYPIGAEAISKALAPVAQLTELKLLFYSSKFHTPLKSNHYEFLRVEYLNNARSGEKWPIGNLYGRPPQGRWEVTVQPVPRVLRHQISQYIVDSALPKVKQWLIERTQILQQGSDLLAFFYDEETNECIPRGVTQPRTATNSIEVANEGADWRYIALTVIHRATARRAVLGPSPHPKAFQAENYAM